MNNNIDIIKRDGEIVAIIIPKNYHANDTEFFTPGSFFQQLGIICRKAGEVIDAHTHNIVKRDVYLTQEVLLIKKGKVKVNFYDSKKVFFEFRILEEGDIIMFAGNGHGFEILEDAEIIEVKQGPYLGDEDKTRFNGIEKNNQ